MSETALFASHSSTTNMSGLECSICLTPIAALYQKVLPCNPLHCFHKHCIDLWLLGRGDCPLCRASVPTKAQPTRWERVLYATRRPVPRELVSEGRRLGFPEIDMLPQNVGLRDSFIAVVYTKENECLIVARNICNWVPQEWLDQAARFGEAVLQFFRRMDAGGESVFLTKSFKIPSGMKCCSLCSRFSTNHTKAAAKHTLFVHNRQ